MKGRRGIALLVLGLALAALAAFWVIPEREAPRSPEQQVPTSWRTARDAPMHALHVGEKKVACSACHAGMVSFDDAGPESGAMTAPSPDVCTTCHGAQAQRSHHGGTDSPTTCLSCHAFGMKAPARCSDCHAAATRAPGAPAMEHHASASASCTACHTVHDADPVRTADCTTCHAGLASTHGSLRVPPRAPDAGGTGTLANDHAAHGDDASAAPAAALCSACHLPHTGGAEARDRCVSCHVQPHARSAGAGRDAGEVTAEARILGSLPPTVIPRGDRIAGHEACVTCHEPHAARKSDVRACAGCHADRIAAATIAGHRTCTGCHAPHAPGEARASCGTCHGAVTTFAAPRVSAHAACTSCHDPHRPQASPAQACVSCHATVRPTHPRTTTPKGEATDCVGCHAPHGKTGAKGPVATHAACASCHRAAKDDRAFHAAGTACTQCHRPHTFQLTGARGAGATFCASCHEAKRAATAARPGHADCAGCHGNAHAPIGKPACAACHAEPARTAPPGHATCTNCHDAHSGALGARAAYTSCHADKAKAQHADVPGSCASCHRPHGPKGPARPPACATCHTRGSLSGLHAAQGHATCGTCHASHAPPRSDRATCTGSCHQDRRDHQPGAKRCAACHLFRQ